MLPNTIPLDTTQQQSNHWQSCQTPWHTHRQCSSVVTDMSRPPPAILLMGPDLHCPVAVPALLHPADGGHNRQGSYPPAESLQQPHGAASAAQCPGPGAACPWSASGIPLPGDSVACRVHFALPLTKEPQMGPYYKPSPLRRG